MILFNVYESPNVSRQNFGKFTAAAMSKSLTEKGHLISNTPVCPSIQTLPLGEAARNENLGFTTNPQS